MILHAPILSTQADVTTLRCQVVLERLDPAGMPEALWFSLPAYYEKVLPDGHVMPFVLALLLPAMRMQEQIVAHGWGSEVLAHQLSEVAALLAGSYAKLTARSCHLVHGVRTSPGLALGRVGLWFDGGVAAFYSLRRLVEQTPPALRPGYGLGFVPQGSSPPTWAPMLASLGMNWIGVQGNLQDFCQALALPWSMLAGVLPGAVLHLLGDFFHTCYLPTPHSIHHSWPMASHPLLIGALASETSRLIPHGGSLSLTDKMLAIADWPLAQQHLKVCRAPLAGPDNCGQCASCLHALLVLSCTDYLEKFQTFPLQREMNGGVTFCLSEELLPKMIQNEFDLACFEDVLLLAQRRNHNGVIAVVQKMQEHYWRQNS